MPTIKVSKENPRTIAIGNTNETRIEVVDRTFTTDSFSEIFIEADAGNNGTVQINSKDAIKDGSRALAAGEKILINIQNWFNAKLSDSEDLFHIYW